jgi:hypothetical protein
MAVPVEISAIWQVEASRYGDRQRAHHDTNGHAHPFDTCWWCGRQRAVCKSKVRHEELAEALGRCDEMNHPSRDRLVLPYRCYWGPGLHWHVKSARSTAEKSKARKRMARHYSSLGRL